MGGALAARAMAKHVEGLKP